MPLPDDFDPWQHLLSMLRVTHNLNVEKTLLGVPTDDLSNSLGGMKLACLMTNDDTVDMTVLRMMLFYFVFKGNLPPPIYGMPVADYQSEITFRPQIKLLFQEDWSIALAESKLPRATAQMSFRLMNETAQTMTPEKAHTWAVRVKEFLGVSNGFVYEKGTVKVTYRDLHHGVDFKLLVVTEEEGIRVIEKILELAEQVYQQELVVVSKTKKNFPVVPGKQLVYGKERNKARKRPITHVRFYRAELDMSGLASPVILYDRIGKYNGLVS